MEPNHNTVFIPIFESAQQKPEVTSMESPNRIPHNFFFPEPTLHQTQFESIIIIVYLQHRKKIMPTFLMNNEQYD